MSKLGKVYVIGVDRMLKDVYPVVYMNKDLIYCKQHGSPHLRCFCTPEYNESETWEYQAFKEAYEAGQIDPYRLYNVYVPGGMKTFFDWIKERSPLEKEIEGLKMSISSYENSYKVHKHRMDSAIFEMNRYNDLINQCREKLKELMYKMEE